MLFDPKPQDIIAQMIADGWSFSIAYSDMPYDESLEGFFLGS